MVDYLTPKLFHLHKRHAAKEARVRETKHGFLPTILTRAEPITPPPQSFYLPCPAKLVHDLQLLLEGCVVVLFFLLEMR